MASALVVGLLAGSGCGSTQPEILRVDVKHGFHFQGWGVSLAWWANIIGDPSGTPQEANGQNGPAWSPRARGAVLQDLFGDVNQSTGADGQPIHPLGLNVVRYNIGASPATYPALPSPDGACSSPTIFGFGKAIPSPQQGSATSSVNLDWDARQISVLTTAIALISAAQQSGHPGSRQEAPILEAFANSPPWWLTSNHCSAGQPSVRAPAQPGPNPSPGSTQPPQFSPFDPFGSSCSAAPCVADVSSTRAAAETYARYLLDVVAALHRDKGIDFATLEPFNEPNDGIWKGCKPGCQEGSNFSPDVQTAVVDALCSYLSDPAFADLRTRISANDENSLNQLLPHLPSWKDRGCVSQINVHGYSGVDQRSELSHAAASWWAEKTGTPADPPLWMSEYGDGDPMKIAVQIADDLQDLRPETWVYWQAIDDVWGLLGDNVLPDPQKGHSKVYPPDASAIKPTARYWALAQYARYIRPGAVVYPLSLPADSYSGRDAGSSPIRVTVAKNVDRTIVVVATNPSSGPGSQTLRLSLRCLSPHAPVTAHQLQLRGGQPHPMSIVAPQLSGDELSDTLPSMTVTTYVFKSSTPPSSSCAAGGRRASLATAAAKGSSGSSTSLAGDLGHLRESDNGDVFDYKVRSAVIDEGHSFSSGQARVELSVALHNSAGYANDPLDSLAVVVEGADEHAAPPFCGPPAQGAPSGCSLGFELETRPNQFVPAHGSVTETLATEPVPVGLLHRPLAVTFAFDFGEPLGPSDTVQLPPSLPKGYLYPLDLSATP